MVIELMKRAAAHLSPATQRELRRMYFRRQIRRGIFETDEAEYALLDNWLRPGDWAVDIGANVGHYTLKMSELVGAQGRVLAFEPVPDTFYLLTANVQQCRYANVSLINAAASDRHGTFGMQVPIEEGMRNFYRASIVEGNADVAVLTIPLDDLLRPGALRVVKIDVEGHERSVLEGMQALMRLHRPVMIVETSSVETERWIEALGYATNRLPGSSNIVCLPTSGAAPG